METCSMSQLKDITLNEALDMAVEKLPFYRRPGTKLRLKNKQYRLQVLQELRMKLCDEDDCPCAQVYGAEAFNVMETRFAIDLDNLDKLLSIIIKYLPTILEIVLKFFGIMLFFCLSMAMSKDSFAQCYVDQYGNMVCNRPTIRERVSGAPLIAPVVNTLQFVLPPYGERIEFREPPLIPVGQTFVYENYALITTYSYRTFRPLRRFGQRLRSLFR